MDSNESKSLFNVISMEPSAPPEPQVKSITYDQDKSRLLEQALAQAKEKASKLESLMDEREKVQSEMENTLKGLRLQQKNERNEKTMRNVEAAYSSIRSRIELLEKRFDEVKGLFLQSSYTPNPNVSQNLISHVGKIASEFNDKFKRLEGRVTQATEEIKNLKSEDLSSARSWVYSEIDNAFTALKEQFKQDRETSKMETKLLSARLRAEILNRLESMQQTMAQDKTLE